jgi:hypothetical protein
MTQKDHDAAHQLTLKIADLMGQCGEPGEVQLFALLSFVAFLVSEADEPDEAGIMALMALSHEIRIAKSCFDS